MPVDLRGEVVLPVHSREFCPRASSCPAHGFDMRHLSRDTLPGHARIEKPLTALQRSLEARRSRDAFQHFIQRLNESAKAPVPSHGAADCWPTACTEHRGVPPSCRVAA